MGIYSIPSLYSWNILWYSPYHLSVRRLSPNVQEDGGWLLLPSAVSCSLSPWYGEVEHWEVYHYRHSSGPLGPIYRENISHPSDPSTHLSSSIPPPTYNSCCRSLQQKPLWFHVFYRLLKNNKVQWSMLISFEIFKSTFFWETQSRSPDSSLGRKLGWAVLEIGVTHPRTTLPYLQSLGEESRAILSHWQVPWPEQVLPGQSQMRSISSNRRDNLISD